MRLLVPLTFVATVLLSTGASAQVFKCERQGRTVYQEQPCETGERATRMDTPGSTAPTAWAGCYEGDLGGWGGGAGQAVTMRVRSGGRGMELTMDEGKEPLPLRPSRPSELQFVQNSIASHVPGTRVVDGVGVPVPIDHNDRSKGDQAAAGLYRVREASGRELLVIILPFTVGFIRKVPCPAR